MGKVQDLVCILGELLYIGSVRRGQRALDICRQTAEEDKLKDGWVEVTEGAEQVICDLRNPAVADLMEGENLLGLLPLARREGNHQEGLKVLNFLLGSVRVASRENITCQKRALSDVKPVNPNLGFTLKKPVDGVLLMKGGALC